MKRILLAAALAFTGACASAQIGVPVERAISRSGQFHVIADPRAIPSAAAVAATAQVGWMQLTPSTMAVNCERVRDAVFALLGAPDQWRGRVTVVLVPPRRNDAGVVLIPSRDPSGWSYRLEVPAETSPDRLVETLTHVVLLEFANRAAGERCAELPRWLSEGVATEIHRVNPQLAVQANRTRALTVVAHDPIAPVRAKLAGAPALTFDQLSWPGTEFSHGARRADYRDSAQLLVHSLLARPGGAARLRNFVSGLAANWNWQITFLKAHSDLFGGLVDVEKWWAVNVAAISGRDQWKMWAMPEALARLDQALRVDVQVSAAAGVISGNAAWPLQRAVTELESAALDAALGQVLVRLVQLRPNCPPELSALVDGYRDVIVKHQEKRRGSPFAVTRGGVAPSARLAAREASERFDALDAQRKRLRDQIAAASR